MITRNPSTAASGPREFPPTSQTRSIIEANAEVGVREYVQLRRKAQESNLILFCAPGSEVGKKSGEDAECGKKRADVIHEADARVVGKLAQQCGADTA